MAQVSKRLRRLRRAKRECSRAYRMLDLALAQRDVARDTIRQLIKKLRKPEEPHDEPLAEGLPTLPV